MVSGAVGAIMAHLDQEQHGFILLSGRF